MLTIDHARQIAQIIVDATEEQLEEPLVLIEPPTEFVGGWLFTYSTQRYMTTGEVSYAIGGNGPIAVFRSGRVELLGSADSVKIHVERLNSIGGL